MTLPFFPARPVNGGPLEQALPKEGDWAFEDKFNGWRLLLHRSGAAFNRHGQPFSAVAGFQSAIAQLLTLFRPCALAEWFDVEALGRRHAHARGSLVLLDLPGALGSYQGRREFMETITTPRIPLTHPTLRLQPDSVYLAGSYRWQAESVTAHWHALQQLNRELYDGAEFYEGIVAKKINSLYLQQHSPTAEFPFWVKHRWAF